jgi:rhamnose transport system substrate-binding protein
MISYNLVKGNAKAEPGAEIGMGRMGAAKLDDGNEAAMSDPFTYDASNIDQFKSIF